jgi:hypothetical protein
VCQGGESHLRRLLRQFCYPLLFREHGIEFRCTRHVSLQRSMTWHLLPSPGSGWLPFPGFRGTMRRSDALPLLPPHFVSFAWRYHPLRLCSSLSWTRRRPGAWSFRSGNSAARWSSGVETTGTPRFLGNPNVPMPCSVTPAGPTSPGPCGESAWPPFTARRRLPHRGNFGARSHGLGTGCLRFARWVSRSGRKTRFWLLAKLYQAGLSTRRVPTKGFRDVLVTSLPPFPSFPGAGCVPFVPYPRPAPASLYTGGFDVGSPARPSRYQGADGRTAK